MFFREQWNAYECLSCGEMIEVPRTAQLKVDGMVQRVDVHGNPENRILWLELHEIGHAACAKFHDDEKLAAHRQFGLRQ